MVLKLMEGFQSHHKTFIPKNFKNKAGKKLRAMCWKCQNSETPTLMVSPTMKYKIIWEKLNLDPNKKETQRMMNIKALGKLGLTTDMP